ncbi:hypothetical protein, partial [Mitsuokella jalaludinii]|uniref:hypothetical protein n=1 Tax=Mitsuokella jalaludinii TaxID=187979 RepID=UPI003079EDA3
MKEPLTTFSFPFFRLISALSGTIKPCSLTLLFLLCYTELVLKGFPSKKKGGLNEYKTTHFLTQQSRKEGP